MQRDLAKMAATHYDVIIIGGGISGACIAWDAALRGLKVALVEKNDFTSATSAAPSKLIHGGLRYLKNLEFGLVRESLRERRYMEWIAPHQVDPLPFMLPTYHQDKNGPIMLLTGMTLYEVLSFDKRWIKDESKRLPSFKYLTKKQTLEKVPGLVGKGLAGSLIYYDCLMHSPERLALEFLISAAEKGADLANYAQVLDFIVEDQRVLGVELEDNLTGEKLELRGDVFVNASGPWADFVLGLLDKEPARSLIRSKGIHLITRPLASLEQAMTLTNKEGEHLFIIPWRNHTLIGTTDREFRGHPDDFRVTEADIQELIDKVNRLYPVAELKREDILHFYGGLRPIVEPDTKVDATTYKASRKHEIYDHTQERIEGLISVIGGKYTTARHLAEQAVDMVYEKLGREQLPCTTDEVQICGGYIENFEEFQLEKQKLYCLYDPELIAHLCENYGCRMEQVMALIKTHPQWGKPLAEHIPNVQAEVIHGIRYEMAIHLSDILFQRTGIGTLGHPGEAALNTVADLMAAELGWDAEQKSAEITQALRRYATPVAEETV